MANFSNGHSSKTGCVKKKKKRVLQITCGYTSVAIYGSKFQNLGGQKNSTKIFGSGTFGLESRQTPPGCRTPPKMVPPYSLGTCPPKTPRTLWCPIAPSLRKHRLSEDPCFWPKYSNGPGVAKNWHMSKWTSWDPRRCLKLSWDQIWQRNVNGKCPKLPKRNCQSLRYKVV